MTVAAEALAARPLRLAMVAPLPPHGGGIGDYVVDLLTLLPDAWRIELYSPQQEAPPSLRVAGRSFPCRRLEELPARAGAAMAVYHVGNAAEHVATMRAAAARPGLVVLHDAVLHPARAAAAVAGRDLREYRRAARAALGGARGAALAHLVAAGLASPQLYWLFPLCEDLVRGSLVTAVHGELLARWLRALVAGARVRALTHWRSLPPVPDGAAARWRRRLGGDDCVLVGSFGYHGPAHRPDVAIRALARLAPRHDLRLVVAGEVDPALGLDRLAAALGVRDRVCFTGRLARAQYGALLRAVDLAVNLRYPTARASSGTLVQLLQAGVPTAITDLLHLRDLPDAAVWRVPPAPAERQADDLAAGLERWLADPAARRAAGAAAREWAAANLRPECMRADYIAAVAAALAATARAGAGNDGSADAL